MMKGCIGVFVPCYAVHEEDHGHVSVEGVDDGPERLLPSGVPYLKPDGCIVIDGNGPGAELHSQGGRIGLLELVGGESVEEGGLAHAGGADDDQFECVLVRHNN